MGLDLAATNRCTSRIGLLTTLIAAFLGTGAPNANASFDRTIGFCPHRWQGCFRAASLDRNRVVYETSQRLSSADRDSANDLYVLRRKRAKLISVGQDGVNGRKSVHFSGAAGGIRTIFSKTRDQLSPEDQDDVADIYAHVGGETILVTPGTDRSFCGYFCGPTLMGTSADGAKLFLAAAQRLAPTDTDSDPDLYERSNGRYELLSDGSLAGGADSKRIYYVNGTPDGNHIFFVTSEALEPADQDGLSDVYERFEGTTRLITPPTFDTYDYSMDTSAVSDDGSRVYVNTAQRLDGGMGFNGYDLYVIEGGDAKLVSTGPTDPGGANGGFDAETADGENVYFTSEEALVADDVDRGFDVYQWSNGVTTLISSRTGNQPPEPPSEPGSEVFGALAADRRVFFQTLQPLVAEDHDRSGDVYVNDGNHIRLVSVSSAGINRPGDAEFEALSGDGRRVFFADTARLDSHDDDGARSFSKGDVYMRDGDTTTLVSKGPLDDDVGFGGAGLEAVNGDGSLAVFSTQDRLTPDDSNRKPDVYLRDIVRERTFLLSAADTRVTSGPVGRTTRRRAVFRFHSSSAPRRSRFLCSLDRKRYRRCRSPIHYRHLELGDHLFRVRAMRSSGRGEPNATERAFEVVKQR